MVLKQFYQITNKYYYYCFHFSTGVLIIVNNSSNKIINGVIINILRSDQTPYQPACEVMP